jgi:hypothetical protein
MEIADDDNETAALPPPGKRLTRPNPRLRREPVREATGADREGAHAAPGKLKRKRKRSNDRLYVDPKLIPPDMTYEWKAKTCFGAPTDPMHWQDLLENHWKPVPKERHPGVVVENDGLVLMERPKYLTQEARQEDFDIAREQARKAGLKLLDTPAGQFTRDHPSVRNTAQLNREFGPITIPEE